MCDIDPLSFTTTPRYMNHEQSLVYRPPVLFFRRKLVMFVPCICFLSRAFGFSQRHSVNPSVSSPLFCCTHNAAVSVSSYECHLFVDHRPENFVNKSIYTVHSLLFVLFNKPRTQQLHHATWWQLVYSCEQRLRFPTWTIISFIKFLISCEFIQHEQS